MHRSVRLINTRESMKNAIGKEREKIVGVQVQETRREMQ